MASDVLRVMIYGSCVTRDAVHLFPDHGLEMVEYVARHGLLSMHSPADQSQFDLAKLSSSFQRRMAGWDIASQLYERLDASSPDLIIWDLCDERLGVAKAAGGVITTAHNYVRDSMFRGEVEPLPPFGDDRHFEAWCGALGEFMGQLEERGYRGRVLANATPWATHGEDGLRTTFHESARAFNLAADRYYAAMGDAGVHVVRVRPSDAISRIEGHQWGPAPFHYLEQTYEAMLAGFSLAIREMGLARP